MLRIHFEKVARVEATFNLSRDKNGNTEITEKSQRTLRCEPVWILSLCSL